MTRRTYQESDIGVGMLGQSLSKLEYGHFFFEKYHNRNVFGFYLTSKNPPNKNYKNLTH